MKAQHNITQIARLLGRDNSTFSRKLRFNAECRGYKAKQACELTCKRSESIRSAKTLAPSVLVVRPPLVFWSEVKCNFGALCMLMSLGSLFWLQPATIFPARSWIC